MTGNVGYNRSTFYAYFTDVYDVLEQIEEDIMPGVEHLPSVEIAVEGSSDIKPLDVVENLINIYEINSKYYSVLLSETGDPAFTIKMRAKQNCKQNHNFVNIP
ncbi:hypothetical protein [Clostridium grantii]|uniref:Transcriptional regulator, TetR family n=1 Tax=Clostridium grantii DSM 8605 TaxID=1121316 RepID=A0A1M5XVA5_9CLOT|nr:hypothetical protein [Clostridium grantii]SHI03642.1 hypothetical protein SAMN02745207_03956 [Clostridium grantii DSM 8605]